MSRSVIAGWAVAAAAGAVALAACGSPVHSPSGGAPTHSGAPVSATPAPPSASGGAAAGSCATASLAVTVDLTRGGAAAGSAYYPIEFRNTSASPCTMSGYPGVSFVTGQGGSIIGSPANRNPSAAAVPATLPAGGYAHAVLQVVNAGNYSASACHPVTAHWLQVYPPGQTAAGYAQFTTQVCSVKLPSNLGSSLTIYPVRAGRGQMGQAP